MNNTELFTMSSQELSRLKVIERLLNNEISQVNAAKMLNITDRQVRNILKKYEAQGVNSLISRKRGLRSNRAYSEEFKLSILNLIQTTYSDFGSTFATEKLEENHNIKISPETLRKWKIANNLHRPKSRKIKIHQSRDPRPSIGELIQIDGSHHDWFEGRAPKCCLIVFIDDATSSLAYCRFEKAETTLGYFKSISDYIKSYGIPLAFYSDKFGVFRVNQPTLTPGITQYARAMKELGIQVICANSPEAKGKVERANRTLQDRLIKELRLKNISSIEEANKFLPQFIAKYNSKFSKLPFSNQNLHKENTFSEANLNYILSIHETRKLSFNLECSYNNALFQIRTNSHSRRLRYAKVTISTDLFGSVSVWYKNTKLEYNIKSKNQREVISSKKNIHTALKPAKKYKPPKSHPWRAFVNNDLIKVSQYKRKFLNGKKPELSKLA